MSAIKQLLASVEPAVGSYRPALLDALWDGVPDGMRLERFVPEAIGARYRAAFHWQPDSAAPLDLSGLPEPMRRELAWSVYRIVDGGGVINVRAMRVLIHRLDEVVDDLGASAPASLTDLSIQQWQHQSALAVHRRTGALPGAGSARMLYDVLLRCYRRLWSAYDPRPWWQREIWDPGLDARIPLRAHEPAGHNTINFQPIRTGWLRVGAQWYFKVALDTGLLCWTTVRARVSALADFDTFVVGQQIRGPWLVEDPARVRTVMLDYLDRVKGLRATRGKRIGQPLSPASAKNLLVAVEQFYAFMTDHQDSVAVVLSEPGWLRLGPAHTRFYRYGERPRPRQGESGEPKLIDEDAFTQIMAGAGQLAVPVADGGLGDPQALHVLMLLARTGRRVSEILLLDHDPLLPLDTPRPSGGPGDPGAFVARLHYQLTKIEGVPATIPVDEEIVAIVRAQQQWASAFLAAQGSPVQHPKYLFLAALANRNGDLSYPSARLRIVLTKLAVRLDVRDGTGRLVDFQRTHRFRHTKATSLLNAGVPLHVVQRYLGHVSPTMTMIYAQTLAQTQEREFLRYRKLTADARDLGLDPRDVYDLLQLDTRTDRILPNGWCLLPPRQTCGKGNACLTCDKFATDVTCLPELARQQTATARLIDQRCRAFRDRTGHDLDPDNVWLVARGQEHDALTRIITTLQQTSSSPEGPAGRSPAVRGAGAGARADALACPDRRAPADDREQARSDAR